jgi:hypothetical protein
MTHPNANAVTLNALLDGRQTAGRKGFAYDWRSVMLEGRDVADIAAPGVASTTMPVLIGLLLR